MTVAIIRPVAVQIASPRPPTAGERLDKEKTAYAAELAAMIAADPAIGVRMPETFQETICALRGLT
jgi:hypothetical protein